jgi:hypothetical protein
MGRRVDDSQTQRADGGRAWYDTTTGQGNQGLLGATQGWKEARKDTSFEALGGNIAMKAP